MSINPKTKGLVHIYHGDGKGKTTAAVGLCVRMLGSGGKVAFIQFLKGRKTGEIPPLEKLGADVYRTNDIKKFVKSMSDEELDICKKDIARCYHIFEESILCGEYDLVVADEILHAVNYDFIPIGNLLTILEEKSNSTEVVLTGRNPSIELCKSADYITHMQAQKHPYAKGISAREGIEY